MPAGSWGASLSTLLCPEAYLPVGSTSGAHLQDGFVKFEIRSGRYRFSSLFFVAPFGRLITRLPQILSPSLFRGSCLQELLARLVSCAL